MVHQRLKLILTILIAGVVVMVAWGLIGYISHLGKTKVAVHAIPDDSTITLNGMGVGGGNFYLKPGRYVFSATRKDFGKVSQTISIQKDSQPQTLYLLPVPNTAAAIEFLNQHPKIQQDRERQGGINSAVNQVSLGKKYPIISKLPAYTSDYRIDYAVDDKQAISFAITLYAILNNPQQYNQYQQQLQTDKAEALQFLRTNGINPTDYKITFTPNI